MGFLGDWMGGFGDMYEGFGKAMDAKDKRSAAYDAKRKYESDAVDDQTRAGMVDYTPAYAADLVPAYERSQSPVARAYLESILTGQNQDDVAPWAAGGEQAKQTAGFNETYGPYDDLVKKGEAYRKTQPWKTKTPGEVDTSAITYRGR